MKKSDNGVATMPEKKPKPKGRQYNAKYTEEVAETLIALIGGGMIIEKACKKVKISVSCFFKWVDIDDKANYKADFADACKKAYKNSAHILADEGLEIIDDKSSDFYTDYNKNGDTIKKPNNANVTRDNHRAEYRKWLASIRDPLNYSTSVKSSQPVELETTFIITQYSKPNEVIEVVNEAIVSSPDETKALPAREDGQVNGAD